MSSYDSESSDDEQPFTETTVLLGYASREATDDQISHLGGRPTWLDASTAPPGNFAKCKSCSDPLNLLLQLNGDLPDRFPGHERRLYLLGCRKKRCGRREGSVRGFRATRASKITNAKTSPSRTPASNVPPAQAQKQPDLGASLFGVKPTSNASSAPNPFAAPSSSTQTQANPFASASSMAAKPPQPADRSSPHTADILPETFASKVRITAPPPSERTTVATSAGPSEPWPSPEAFPPAYPLYHLDADYEALDAEPTTIPSNARVDMEIDGEEGSNAGGGSSAEDKEAFESAMDKTFQRFADRVGQNPEQVLRYEFGGQPLLYSKQDSTGKMLHQGQGAKGRVPKCGNCGEGRVFEVQLTPHAITELEAEEMGIEGMEWGTVIMMVCGKDCLQKGTKENEVGYVEEWVGVQWEELMKRR